MVPATLNTANPIVGPPNNPAQSTATQANASPADAAQTGSSTLSANDAAEQPKSFEEYLDEGTTSVDVVATSTETLPAANGSALTASPGQGDPDVDAANLLAMLGPIQMVKAEAVTTPAETPQTPPTLGVPPLSPDSSQAGPIAPTTVSQTKAGVGQTPLSANLESAGETLTDNTDAIALPGEINAADLATAEASLATAENVAAQTIQTSLSSQTAVADETAKATPLAEQAETTLAQTELDQTSAQADGSGDSQLPFQSGSESQPDAGMTQEPVAEIKFETSAGQPRPEMVAQVDTAMGNPAITEQAAAVTPTEMPTTGSTAAAARGSAVSSLGETIAGLGPTPVPQQAVAAMAHVIESSDGMSKTMNFQLNPADLGRLSIQITQQGEVVAAQIVASELLSSDLLNNQKATLETALSELGFQDATVDVSHDDGAASDQPGGDASLPFAIPTPLAATTNPLPQNRSTDSGGINITA